MKLYFAFSLFLLAVFTAAQASVSLQTNSTLDVSFLLENSDPYPCIFTFGVYTVNICEFSPYYFDGSYGNGIWNYSASLIDNTVTSCDGSQQIWGTFSDYNGCHDIATQKPNYSFQNPGVPTSSLNALFPVQESSTSNTNFQLSITLNCNQTKDMLGFYLKSVVTDITSNLTTIYLGGLGPFACGMPIGCSAVAIGNSNYYNLCPLQQSNMVFNKSDGVFGQLSFNIGNTPLIPNCPGNNGNYVFATYTTRNDCYTLAENALTYSEYSNFNNNGLQVVFPQFTSPDRFYVNVTIQLQCLASQLNVATFDSGMNFNAQIRGPLPSVYANSTLQGTSPYACPITPNNTETLEA